MANPVAALWKGADTYPDRIAVRSGERILRYGDLRARIARSAARFAALGVSPGDRVLLVAPSIPEFAIAHYGLHTIGATIITVNTMSTTHEIDYVVDDSGTSLIVAWHESAAAADLVATNRGLPFVELKPFEDDPVTDAPSV